VKLKLVDAQKKISRDRILLMNRARMMKKIERDRKYLLDAEKQFVELKTSPLFIAGLMLYWGEGEKFGTWRVSVINTDAKMMQIMIRFYREMLKVPEHKIRVGLFIYEDLSESIVKKYWSQQLNLPIEQFIKTHVLPSKGKPGKKKSPYGMCNLYAGGTELKIKMMRWIELFALEYTSNIGIMTRNLRD
jgi:hypothetical protein